jgi:hypothetical protein
MAGNLRAATILAQLVGMMLLVGMLLLFTNASMGLQSCCSWQGQHGHQAQWTRLRYF